MTLREFSNICWYQQEIVVVDYLALSNKFNPREVAMATVTPHSLRSCVYDKLNNRMVKSFGVIDGDLVVEVESRLCSKEREKCERVKIADTDMI